MMQSTYLVLSKISIKNANAMSSTITVGFPAMTAWLGFSHALERNLRNNDYPDFRVSGVAVFSHAFHAQLAESQKTFRTYIIGGSNPLRKKGKDFVRPPIVEEPRCHLVVSLLLKIEGVNENNKESTQKQIAEALSHMKIAGGDIENIDDFFPKQGKKAQDLFQEKIRFVSINDESDQDEQKLLRSMMPSYTLIERRDLLEKKEPSEKDVLSHLVNLLATDHLPIKKEDEKKVTWESNRRVNGWIVPIGVGFKDISGPVKVKNQRNMDYDHHFVEPVVTLGEFKMAHRIESIQDVLWEYHADLKEGLYVCRNK